MKCIALMHIEPEQSLSGNAMGEGHITNLKDGTEAIKTPLRRSAPPMGSDLGARGRPSENGSPTTIQILPATFSINPPPDQAHSKFVARTAQFWSSTQISAATPP